jgi:hypothetical protein
MNATRKTYSDRTTRRCPECGKRRRLYAIHADEARRFDPPRPAVGTEICFECIENPPPRPPRDTVADLIHVATLCQHAARDFAKNRSTSKIAASVALDLLRELVDEFAEVAQ